MNRSLRVALIVVVLLLLAAGAYILFVYDPSTAGFYPRCPSKYLTGYDCPGCGSLRGFHAILHGDFATAWHFNPALFFAAGLLVLIGIAGIHRRPPVAKYAGAKINKLSRKTARITDHWLFPIAILVAIVVWTILRNL